MRTNAFGLAEMSRNGLEKKGGYNAGMPVPLTWDDKAGCISAHCGGKRLILDMGFARFFSGILEITAQFFGC